MSVRRKEVKEHFNKLCEEKYANLFIRVDNAAHKYSLLEIHDTWGHNFLAVDFYGNSSGVNTGTAIIQYFL